MNLDTTGSGALDELVAVLTGHGERWRIAAHLIVDCGIHPAAAHRLAADPDRSATDLTAFPGQLDQLLHPEP